MPTSKESTARIAMFKELKTNFVYTLEASFAGANRGEKQGQHFSVGDLMNIGKSVLRTIVEAKKIAIDRIQLKKLNAEIDSESKRQLKDQNGEESSSDDEGDEESQATEKLKKIV